jgi:alkanesulfonate monooxygenase SsuD/methylene tetrahydromethanopterin reductase-like flavin-dependent oxidoreductase (luciferase family)
LNTPLSILDLAPIRKGESPSDSFRASVALARLAEKAGYSRVWYAEHHNMSSIASSATSVLIAHIAAHTVSIRLGAGGIMLPNHSPLVIAEQFGTLEAMHPGRIDLGLGRAPGSDQNTLLALRRTNASAERFPDDVLELQGYLNGVTRISGVYATPAVLGLPYAFASHFAPDALEQAVAGYRSRFRPSVQLDHPYVIAGVNVVASDTTKEAQAQFLAAKRQRVNWLFGKGRTITDDEADLILESPAGQHVQQMSRYSAVGTPDEVRDYLEGFVKHADADELIVVHQSPGTDERLRSVELLAEAALDS